MYNPSKFKYGNKSTSEIESILNRVSGDSVYDNQRYKRDFYDGYINLNQDMISLTASTTITKGYGVKMTTTGNTVNLSINTSNIIGVAIQTATINNKVAIAIGGIYPAYYSGAISRSKYTIPIITPSGQFSGTTTPSISLCGIVLQSGSTSGLLNTLIIPTEKI